MSSYIQDNLVSLKSRHYIRKARFSTNYWFDFTQAVVQKYQNKHGDDFCMVVQGSIQDNDAYILPYGEFRAFFSEELLDHRLRWIGYVSKNVLRIATSGKGKSISISRYYNAFDLLHSDSGSPDLVVQDPDIIRDEVNEIALNHLRQAIKAFNEKYVNVVPVKKIVVSEQVARPGLVSDYLKSLRAHTCQICGQGGFRQRNNSLYAEAHHIMELHKLIAGSYCSDNIIVVCPTCHKKLHFAVVNYKIVDDMTYEITINGDRSQVSRNVLTR